MTSSTRYLLRIEIGENKQVYFSQGNLCANYGSLDTWSWEFAPDQWSCFGNEMDLGFIVITGNGTVGGDSYIDLFGWSTDATYYGIHNSEDDADYSGAFIDWGNTIGNGWYTMDKGEWYYLLGLRENASEKYGYGSIDDVKGLIILPDTWTLPTDLTFTAGNSDWANSYTTTEWEQMEAAGAVFLPTAGCRGGTFIEEGLGSDGYYWSSTPYGNEKAYCMTFNSINLDPQYTCKRHHGLSVRLVKDAN